MTFFYLFWQVKNKVALLITLYQKIQLIITVDTRLIINNLLYIQKSKAWFQRCIPFRGRRRRKILRLVQWWPNCGHPRTRAILVQDVPKASSLQPIDPFTPIQHRLYISHIWCFFFNLYSRPCVFLLLIVIQILVFNYANLIYLQFVFLKNW